MSGAVCSAASYVTLSGVTIESGGTLWIGSGCAATNVTGADGAVITLNNGGTVEYAE